MKKGKLTIFTSYTPGAGKSYLMVEKAMEQRGEGQNVVIGFLNSRHRAIDSLLIGNGIAEAVDDKITKPESKGIVEAVGKKYSLTEIMAKSPDLVVMDEMGMHHINRDEKSFVYEDVERLLQAGIDVYASTNLKKFEKINPLYKELSGIGVKKLIPDYFLKIAEHIYFVDREPELMIRDFKSGELFGERYMKTKIMNKNFQYDTLCAYRDLSKKCLAKYSHKTSIVERN